MNDDLFTTIKDVLDFFNYGPYNDPYFNEKKSAKYRLLHYCYNQLECDELRRIILKKINNYKKLVISNKINENLKVIIANNLMFVLFNLLYNYMSYLS